VVVVVVVVVVVIDLVDDLVVDRHAQKKHLVHMMFVMNVVVSYSNLNQRNFTRKLVFLDRGHYAYDCEVRLRRQRRMRYDSNSFF